MCTSHAKIAKRDGVVVPQLMLNVEVPLLRLCITEIFRKDEETGRSIDCWNRCEQVRIRDRNRSPGRRVGERLYLDSVLGKRSSGKDGRSHSVEDPVPAAQNGVAVVRRCVCET